MCWDGGIIDIGGNNDVALFIGDGRWSGHTVRGCSRSIVGRMYGTHNMVRCTDATISWKDGRDI